jgi:transglutaminase-like putative cysteine protease
MHLPALQRPWLREALWCALIAPMVAAPLLGFGPRPLLALGSALAFWRAYLIGKRAIHARQHEVALPVGTHGNWMLLASLAVVLAPHALRLPAWLTVLVALFIGWRIGVMRAGLHGTTQGSRQGWWRRGLAPPPRLLMIVMVSAASIGVFLQYGTLFGREPGVALLSLMIAMKLLELRSLRDATVLVFLAYFLVITNFLYSQTLPTAFLMLVAVLLITATMISFHQREPRFRQTVSLAAQLLVQAVPLMIVLFLFFPRLPGPLWGLPRDAGHGVTGLSDSMSPGSFSQLSASADVAFRVEFRDAMPRTGDLYWRGPVFWQFDGRIWSIGSGPPGPTPPPTIRALSEPVAYTVTLEPHHERWLLALDMPTALPPDTRLSSEFVLLANGQVRNRVRYEGRAAIDYRANENETEANLRRALQLPSGLNPRTLALAAALRAEGLSSGQIVERVLDRFRSEPFFYTTSPPLLDSRDAVDQFLFESRRGFCEHYASAFTVLMRAAGVPARVVTGYQGGVVNPVGNYLVVRQAEAHAWSEVWLPGRGWVRVDPTAAVSPLRVESGIAASIAQDDPLPMMVRGSLPMLSRAGFAVDAVANAWNQWVLSYNTQRQQQFLRNLGIDSSDWKTLSMLLLAGACAATLLAALFSLRTLLPGREDPVARAWERLCRKLARAGLARLPGEGPTDFARRVAIARPDLAAPVTDIADRYVRLRYRPPGPGQTDAAGATDLQRRIRMLKT